MSKKVFSNLLPLQIIFLSLVFSMLVFSSCSVSAKSADEELSAKPVNNAESKKDEKAANIEAPAPAKKGRIQIAAGSPAEVVKTFYGNLRGRRFREAMMMTNLRVAIEGLSDAEMQDLSTDFEPLAQQVPEELEIKGEIITNNIATVTTRLPDVETGKYELNEIELRRDKDSWIIVTADEKAEAMAKKEGKNYFFTLRMDIHHAEASAMMERIAKAQTVYAMQNGGQYGEINALISRSLLPEDITNSRSTGYRFEIVIGEGGKKYVANAVPETYGRSGKFSYILVADTADQKARLKSADNKGKPLKK